jgi:NADPH-dependent ferric siderophore reductase
MSEHPTQRAARSPYRRVSKNRRILRAHVINTRRLSPGMMGVTIGGPDLVDFQYFGDDHAFRLFFPRSSHTELHLPPATAKGWMVPYTRMRSADRPHVRFYTVRAFRKETLELDIEFVAHGSDSPGSGWALRAQPGDEVGIFDEGAMHVPPPANGWQLLVGDESALPAILAILEQQPPALHSHALIEVPTQADVRDSDVPNGSTIHWLPRNDESALPGRLALHTLEQFDFPATAPASTYVAGESGLVTSARRFLVRSKGLPKTTVKFVGYWKHGHSSRD